MSKSSTLTQKQREFLQSLVEEGESLSDKTCYECHPHERATAKALASKGLVHVDEPGEGGFFEIKLTPAGIALIRTKFAPQDSAEVDAIVEIEVFSPPSGTVLGVGHVSLPLRGKSFTLAKVTLMVAAEPDIHVKWPAKVSLVEADRLTQALTQFNARLAEVLAR